MMKILSTIATLLITTAHAGFIDVPTTHPNSDAIHYVQAEKIVHGYLDGSYRPNNKVNRAEFTKIIVEALSLNTSALCKIASFSDIPIDAWYWKYAQAARCSGLISGYDDGTFRGAKNISFVEAAKIITIAFDKPFDKEGEWYEGFVRLLQSLGAIPSDIVTLDQPVTRGQIAEMIYRIKNDIRYKDSTTLTDLIVQTHVSNGTNEPQTESIGSLDLPSGFTSFVEFIPTGIESLANAKTQDIGNFEEYHRGNVYLYIERRNNLPVRTILHVKGQITPNTNGFWSHMQGTKLSNIIAWNVAQGFELSNVSSEKLPGEIANAVKTYYDGSLDLPAGQHAISELELQGLVRDVVDGMNFPTKDLIANIGRELPSFSIETGAAGAVEKSKKGGSFADALEETNYIEILAKGVWGKPMGMERTTVTDATVYLDDGPTFGFWGNGRFDGDKFVMFYKGPLVRSKEPQDYVEAQVGFGAEQISLNQYLKLIAAYNSRLPNTTYGFMGNIADAKKQTLDHTFAALDAMPLDIVDIANKNLQGFTFKSGDNFPDMSMFNAVILGPLAEAKNGTKGPLIKLKGDSRILKVPFGSLDMEVSINGAKATAVGDLGISLGSAGGKDLGKLGGSSRMNLTVNTSVQAFDLIGNFNAGPFIGREVVLSIQKDAIRFASPATCSFPLDIRADAKLPSDPRNASLQNVFFVPKAFMPSPEKLLSCPEDIFYAIKDGVVYVFTKGKVLAEMGIDQLPTEDIDKIGKEGLRFANGAYSEGKQALKDAAKQIPVLKDLPVQCGFETVEDGALCGFDFVTNGAKCGFDIVTDAAICGLDSVTNAAKCGFDVVKSGPKCGWDTVTSTALCGLNLVTSGPQCGWDTVKDAAKCGESYVTNGVECGRSSYSCALTPWKWGTCWSDLSCWVPKTCDVARSCNVPNTCNIAKSCKVPASCKVPKTCADPSKPKSCDVPKSCTDFSKPVMCQ